MRSFLLSICAVALVAFACPAADKPDHAELLRLHNEARKAAGVPPLIYSDVDAAWAEGHSQCQADYGGICWHSKAVLTRTDFYWSENVAWKGNYTNGDRNVYSEAEVHQGWMDSPGHRANLLSRDWRYVGFGHAVGPNGSYWTAVFSKVPSDKGIDLVAKTCTGCVECQCPDGACASGKCPATIVVHPPATRMPTKFAAPSCPNGQCPNQKGAVFRGGYFPG